MKGEQEVCRQHREERDSGEQPKTHLERQVGQMAKKLPFEKQKCDALAKPEGGLTQPHKRPQRPGESDIPRTMTSDS